MSNASPSASGSIGVFGLLGIVFVTLKLTGFLNWSWWWITLPFWAGITLVLGGALVWLLVYGCYLFIVEKFSKRPVKKTI